MNFNKAIKFGAFSTMFIAQLISANAFAEDNLSKADKKVSELLVSLQKQERTLERAENARNLLESPLTSLEAVAALAAEIAYPANIADDGNQINGSKTHRGTPVEHSTYQLRNILVNGQHVDSSKGTSKVIKTYTKGEQKSAAQFVIDIEDQLKGSLKREGKIVSRAAEDTLDKKKIQDTEADEDFAKILVADYGKYIAALGQNEDCQTDQALELRSLANSIQTDLEDELRGSQSLAGRLDSTIDSKEGNILIGVKAKRDSTTIDDQAQIRFSKIDAQANIDDIAELKKIDVEEDILIIQGLLTDRVEFEGDIKSDDPTIAAKARSNREEKIREAIKDKTVKAEDQIEISDERVKALRRYGISIETSNPDKKVVSLSRKEADKLAALMRIIVSESKDIQENAPKKDEVQSIRDKYAVELEKLAVQFSVENVKGKCQAGAQEATKDSSDKVVDKRPAAKEEVESNNGGQAIKVIGVVELSTGEK